MSESWAVQASYKFGVGGQNMLNVRGESAEDLSQHLAALADGDVVTSITHLGAVLEAGNNLTPVTSSAAPPPPAAPSNVAQFPQQPPAAPAVQAPTCPHGTRLFKRGVGAKGAWAAYFCPAPKGDPSACAPDWQKA